MQTGTCTYQVHTCVHFFGVYDGDPKNNIPVADRDPSKVIIPDNAHSFVFYDAVTATIEMDGRTVTLVNRDEHVFPFGRLNQSPVHYCGGKLFTLEEGERLFHDHESVDTTLEAMDPPSTIFDAIRKGKYRGVTHVILCRDGNIRLFQPGWNVIVPLPGTITI